MTAPDSAGGLELEDIHEGADAALEELRGKRVPAWYGSDENVAVAAEYGAARSGAAIVDLSDRGLLRATGPQRQKFLHSLLSNDVDLPPGCGSRNALMDVKGHIQALIRCSVTAQAVVMELPGQQIEATEKILLHYKVAAPVRFARGDEVVLGLLGPDAEQTLVRTGGSAPGAAPESHMEGTIADLPLRIIRAGDLPALGLMLHVPAATAAAVWDALVAAGAAPLGRRALDVLRIEDGCPWYGPDVSDAQILHETGMLAAYHSSAKGCYLGQEVVARLEGRGGHVNKQLRALQLTAPASPGATIEVDEREVGRITTYGTSPEHGPIAMGYIHRDHYDPGTVVTVDGRRATVASLPFGT
jgi:folate-binding protein YgfZ